MKLISLIRYRFTPVLASFLLVAFSVGIASSLQFPTLSRFLTDEVTTPGLIDVLNDVIAPKQFWVGLFYSVSAIAAMIVSFLLAVRSDRLTHRKKLILFCCGMAFANTLLFACSRHYLLLISLGVIFSALGSCVVPQLFALAREYTDHSARDAAMFSSIMRAQISLAWVIGPPLAFMLATNFGFTFMYLAAGAVFLLGGVMIHFLLPSVPKVVKSAEQQLQQQQQGSGLKDKNIIFLFMAMVLLLASNMMYLIDMPIYTDKQLGLSKDLAGYLMGTAAGLEIPFMIAAGYYVRKLGKRRLVVGAVISAGCFYTGLILFDSALILLLLQLFNAIFIGIVAGIGMLYFQDLMPGRAGQATTLFANSGMLGTILAGMLQGSISGAFGHQAVYCLAVVFTLVALICILQVKEV